MLLNQDDFAHGLPGIHFPSYLIALHDKQLRVLYRLLRHIDGKIDTRKFNDRTMTNNPGMLHSNSLEYYLSKSHNYLLLLTEDDFEFIMEFDAT